MFEQLELIRNAAQVLAVRDASKTEQLLQACETLWERMYEPREWSPVLEEKARVLVTLLLSYGSVEDTFLELGSDGIEAVADDILGFVDAIESENGALACR